MIKNRPNNALCFQRADVLLHNQEKNTTFASDNTDYFLCDNNNIICELITTLHQLNTTVKMFIFHPLTEGLFTLLVGCLTLLPKNNNYDLVCSSAENLLQVEPMPNVDRLTIIGRMELPDVLRKEHVKNFTQVKTFLIHYGVNDIEDEALHGLKSLKTLYVGNCNVPVIKGNRYSKIL